MMPDLDEDSEAAFWRDLRSEAGKDRANFGDRNDWFKAERAKANRVICFDCGAAAGDNCRRIGEINSVELQRFPAHARRVNTAKALFG